MKPSLFLSKSANAASRSLSSSGYVGSSLTIVMSSLRESEETSIVSTSADISSLLGLKPSARRIDPKSSTWTWPELARSNNEKSSRISAMRSAERDPRPWASG
eukprot:Amastigsp_a1943_32.p3 type:complete len:103 gc:universal Amastigsp_a1943_32:265-573(+)